MSTQVKTNTEALLIELWSMSTTPDVYAEHLVKSVRTEFAAHPLLKPIREAYVNCLVNSKNDFKTVRDAVIDLIKVVRPDSDAAKAYVAVDKTERVNTYHHLKGKLLPFDIGIEIAQKGDTKYVTLCCKTYVNKRIPITWQYGSDYTDKEILEDPNLIHKVIVTYGLKVSNEWSVDV